MFVELVFEVVEGVVLDVGLARLDHVAEFALAKVTRRGRCSFCASWSTLFRLQPLPLLPGVAALTRPQLPTCHSSCQMGPGLGQTPLEAQRWLQEQG